MKFTGGTKFDEEQDCIEPNYYYLTLFATGESKISKSPYFNMVVGHLFLVSEVLAFTVYSPPIFTNKTIGL